MSSYLTELAYDRSTSLVYRDPQGRVPASCALTLESPSGTVLQTPTVTVATTTTTIASGSTDEIVNVASATGLAVGDLIIITDDGVEMPAEIARIDTAAITLVHAIDFAPTTGAAVRLVKMTATITAPGASEIGSGYRLRWVATMSGGAIWDATEPASVVRWTWTEPATVSLVEATIEGAFGSSPAVQTCQVIASRVNSLIRGGLSGMQRRPHLYPSSHVMDECAIRGTLLVAIDHGYKDRSDPNDAFNRRRAFDESLGALKLGIVDYDSDDTGSTVPGRAWGFTARATR